jgi:hypothetical protein
MTDFLGKVFKSISDVVNGAEKSLLDLLSALVPYFVPVIPAYLTYYHTYEQMKFPAQVAWTAAFVVEVLGMTAVSTAIRFWRHNLKYTSVEKRAPFGLAIAVYVFYIVIVLSVNVVLEMVSGTRGGWVIFSIALFSLLSVPSGVLISIRAQYTEALEEAATKKASKTKQVTVGAFKKDTPLEKLKVNERRETITVICANPSCRKPNREFVTRFPNKKTCSDACRKALSRAGVT